jgi:hypothetical protein
LQGDGDAVLVKTHLGINDLGECLTAAADVFQAVRGPFQRAAELAGRDADQQFLRVKRPLRSKTAAYVGGNHPQAAAGKAEGFGNRVAHDAGDVRGGIERDGAALGVILGRVAARLHRERRLARHLEAAADPDGRTLQIRFDVTFSEFARDQHVGAGLFVQQRSVLRDGVLAARHRAERFKLDLNELDRVFREVPGSRDDSDDGFADITDLAGSQWQDRRRVIVGHSRHRYHRLEIIGNVISGEHGDDARRGLRGRCIDPHDPRMRLFAAAEGDV